MSFDLLVFHIAIVFGSWVVLSVVVEVIQHLVVIISVVEKVVESILCVEIAHLLQYGRRSNHAGLAGQISEIVILGM